MELFVFEEMYSLFKGFLCNFCYEADIFEFLLNSIELNMFYEGLNIGNYSVLQFYGFKELKSFRGVVNADLLFFKNLQIDCF